MTSIRPDKRELARLALELLIQRLDGSEAKPRDVRLGYELIVRESTALA